MLWLAVPLLPSLSSEMVTCPLAASSISYKLLAATISFENLEYPLMLTMPWDNLNNFVGVIATNKDRILRT